MRIIAAFLILLLPFSFVACGRQENTSCREILHAMTEAEIGLPTGKVYSMHSPDGDGEQLPDKLIARIFGEGTTPAVASGWLDLALFLSTSAHPCEFAVILCDSEDTATDTARLLCRRLDAIRTAKGAGEYAKLTENATVTVIGNYALLIISSDTENAIKSASKIIG